MEKNGGGVWAAVALLVPVATAVLIPAVSFLGGKVLTLSDDLSSMKPVIAEHARRLDRDDIDLKEDAKNGADLKSAISGLTSAVEALTREFSSFERDITASPDHPAHRH